MSVKQLRAFVAFKGFLEKMLSQERKEPTLKAIEMHVKGKKKKSNINNSISPSNKY